jgi:hypothetical protein
MPARYVIGHDRTMVYAEVNLDALKAREPAKAAG